MTDSPKKPDSTGNMTELTFAVPSGRQMRVDEVTAIVVRPVPGLIIGVSNEGLVLTLEAGAICFTRRFPWEHVLNKLLMP